MSDEKRLGVNPLSWVDPTTETNTPIRTGSVAATEETTTPEETETPPQACKTRLFHSPTTIHEEELMGKAKVKIKQTMETAQAVSHLEDLADSLSSGVIRAENGEDSVVLCTGESLKFEMKLSRKKGKAKCSIEMEWEDDGSAAPEFKISG